MRNEEIPPTQDEVTHRLSWGRIHAAFLSAGGATDV
jgi:hypothetical protein